ncbi:hypothetical protein [Dryocola clanedunensis]
MKKLLLALAIIGLSGCATEVVPPSKAIKAPSERIYKYQSEEKGNTSLTVIRDSGFTGGGCFASIYIDGDLVAKLNTSEKATFYLNSGDRAVGAVLDGKGLCGANGERQERYISLNPQEHKYVRVFISSGGDMDIRPTTLK